jgi:Secretion system C-terminal sorting domain
MKKLLTHLFTVASAFSTVITLNAQSINVVPNPTSTGSFTWASTGGALSGYTGTPIIFNNSLVLEYNATGTSDVTQIKQQLAVYKDGDSLHLIPNPDGGQGVYFQSIQIIFNNKLFFIYLNASGVQQLASFDGTSITLYPNPDAAGPGTGFVGSPRIYNNTLYVAYVNVSGVTQFGTFNGSGITLIPNPDNSATGFFNDYSVVFDNKICSRYVTAVGPKQLATFDGTSWTVLPNPDNTTNGFTPVFPVIYHNKLYIRYRSATTQLQYMQYDGVNNPTLIPNPEDGSTNSSGVLGFPIVYNDTLFLQYYNTSNVFQLAKFDGTTITLVPNPDATTYGFYNTPIVYNNNLYIFYVTPDGLHHIGEYQSASNGIKVYPNPDAGSGYWDQPIVYNNNLYFQYYNVSGLSQLGYFGGSSIKLVSNPAGAYSSPNGNNGYLAQPIIWNNLLYMQIASVPYANAGNLAFIDGSTLPITLLNFTAQKDGNTSLLQWKVANETNNAYFSVEHSSDGTNFQSIGQVAGHGTISTEQKYQFTDNNPIKGLNYYRLKQVDYDGNYTYSNVVAVTFENVSDIFKSFPNPAVNVVYLTLPSSTAKSVINVFDLNGKKVLEKQISSNAVSQTLDVSTLAAGVYHVTLVQGAQQQTIKMIKE